MRKVSMAQRQYQESVVRPKLLPPWESLTALRARLFDLQEHVHHRHKEWRGCKLCAEVERLTAELNARDVIPYVALNDVRGW